MTTISSAMQGKVTYVFDGDTVEINCDGNKLRVRLAGIDTPESGQPYGDESRAALAELVLHKSVKVENTSRDQYGRVVGWVKVGRTEVNKTLVEQGHAWVYRQFNDQSRLLDIEEKARRARRGLWRLPKAQREPPWEWRKDRAEREAAIHGRPRARKWGAWLALAVLGLAAGGGLAYYYGWLGVW